MADLLQQLKKRNYNPQNIFSSDARLAACDSTLKPIRQIMMFNCYKKSLV
jgi:hypothetical protein